MISDRAHNTSEGHFLSSANAPNTLGFISSRLREHGAQEIFLTRSGVKAKNMPKLAQQVAQEYSAQIMWAEYFDAAESEVASPQARAWRTQLSTPLSWLYSGRQAGINLGGMHFHAVTGLSVKPLESGGIKYGTIVEGPHAVECFGAGIFCPNVQVPAPQQARATFEHIEKLLDLAEMEFKHVVRTWFFLEDILSWYDEFNAVRTAFFRERGVFDYVVPASTGIGARNPFGAAVMAGFYAVKPKDEAVKVLALPSPLQCPALQYGSSFSRAVEVTMPDIRRVLVSGTASIALDGQTMHCGNVWKQIARTYEVVAAILHSRGLSWHDVTRATAYFRKAADAPLWAQFCAQQDIPPLPVIVTCNVICRDDLLFELEVDAVVPNQPV